MGETAALGETAAFSSSSCLFQGHAFASKFPLSRASFFKQSFHKGQLLQAGLLLARASFYKQAFASQCTWQWMKHASFLKDIPFPRCCGIAMPFCKASPGEPFARVILFQGLVLQLQPKTFCKVRPGPFCKAPFSRVSGGFQPEAWSGVQEVQKNPVLGCKLLAEFCCSDTH